MAERLDLTQGSCREFVAALASNAPTPGGGGAAALVGAIGTALGSMVGSLTVGKKKYAAVEAELMALMAECGSLQDALLDQVAADAACFAPLAKAYSIPKDDPGRDSALEEATLNACAAPLEIMRLCARAIELAGEFAAKGSRLALSDAGCAAILCKAALQAASLNVFINTGALRDRAAAEALDARANGYLAACEQADAVFAQVRAAL